MASALYSIQPVLDHLSEGLKECGILKLMRMFPECFISLFVSTGDLSKEDVLEALCTDSDDNHDPVLDHLHTFVTNLDKKGDFSQLNSFCVLHNKFL